jgi:hypothetical protein
MPEGPYRESPPDLLGLGWIEERGSSATLFVRNRASVLSGLAVLAPVVIFARVLFGSVEQLSLWGWSVVISFVVGVIMLWPISREQIRIDARGMRWRDRLVGLRARVALDRLDVRVRGDARHGILSIGDGRAFWTVASGDGAAIEALAQAIKAAIARSNRNPPEKDISA